MTNLFCRWVPAAPIVWLATVAVAVASPESRTDDPSVAELRQQLETEDPALAAQFDRPLGRDQLLQLALQRNLGLDVARRAHEVADKGIGIAVGEFYPELQLVLNGRRIEALEGVSRRKDAEVAIVQRLPIGTALSAGLRFEDTNADGTPATGIPNVALVQPLLRGAGWETNTSGIRDARLAAESQQEALRAEILRITFAVDVAYFEILRRQQLIEVNNRAVARDQELLDYSNAKLSAQLATQRDVLSAEIILAQDRGRLVNAEAQYQAALDDMSNLLGLRIGRPLEVEHVELEVVPTAIDEDASVDMALRDNPNVLRGRIELERSDLSRDVTGNDRLPQLDLRVAYSQRREPLDHEPLERAWEGGVVMSYPFLNKTLGGIHERAELQYEQQRRAALEIERTTILSVRDAVRNLQRSQDRISILKKNIEGAQAKVEFAKVNFQLGRASNLDITDAQKDLLDAETDFVNELVFYRQGLARLDQLTGGSK